MTDTRISWKSDSLMSANSLKGSLGGTVVGKIMPEPRNDSWKLDLYLPGLKTSAVVRYLTVDDAQGAAEEILGRWMRDVGMRWEPERGQVREWTRVGIQYDGMIRNEVRLYKNEDMANADLVQDKVGLFKNGKVVRQVIEEIMHDWKPVRP